MLTYDVNTGVKCIFYLEQSQINQLRNNMLTGQFGQFDYTVQISFIELIRKSIRMNSRKNPCSTKSSPEEKQIKSVVL